MFYTRYRKMIYIMSDIHGLYNRYKAMLEKIDLKENDKLYILGDVIDRGPDGIEILLDIMDRDNVELFLGNHEHMMLTYIYGIETQSWFFASNGGKVTYDKFMELDKKTKNEILDYLKNKTTILKNLDINNHKYVLSHTSALLSEDLYTKDFVSNLMYIQDIVWNSSDISTFEIGKLDESDEEITFISGHIITRNFQNNDDIYIKEYSNGYKWIDIDCGCAMGDGFGKLSCLKIDDDGLISDVYYVN